MWSQLAMLCFFTFLLNFYSTVNSTPCSDQQVAFDNSCYDFVRFQRTFRSAQGWCERGGGHLVFILNAETQQFLQQHLTKDKEWWIGLARMPQNVTSDATYGEESLAWLDGADVSYSNWFKDESSSPASQCGYILGNSGYTWGRTENCNQEFYFVCQFEFGHTIACNQFNATLQCGSGHVIEIDDSFYGRKNLHYCWLENEPQSEMEEECTWIDVRDSVASYCHGLQVCQTAIDGSSITDPCPSLGNYLSVDYHCKEGLQLSVEDVFSVFENVTICVKWLLNPYSGNLTCAITTGDGGFIDPYNPQQMENVIHRYNSSGVFTVSVECSTSEWHVAAQTSVIIQQPISNFGTVKCYSMNKSEDISNCSALYGEIIWIQVELKAGTNVTYSVFAGNITLTVFTVLQGDSPYNITIDPAAQHLIGPGTHQVNIIAANNVTTSKASQEVTIHLIEQIAGLQAVLNSKVLKLGDDLSINVTVAHGAPVKLQFEFTGSNKTFFDVKDSPDGQPRVFTTPVHSEGTFPVKVLATNLFSEMTIYIGNITVTTNPSLPSEQGAESYEEQASSLSKNYSSEGTGVDGGAKANNGNEIKKGNEEEDEKQNGNESKSQDNKGDGNGGPKATITIEPQMHIDPFTQVTLSCPENAASEYLWSCGTCWPGWNECVQQNHIEPYKNEIKIPPSCLPVPNSVVSVILTVSKDGEQDTAEECFFVTIEAAFEALISQELKARLIASLYDVGRKELLVCDKVSSPLHCTENNVQLSRDVKRNIAAESPLYCGPKKELSSVYLPMGDENNFKLDITITVRDNFGSTSSTVITATVTNIAQNHDNKTLEDIISDTTSAILKEDNSSSTLMQFYKSLSSILNQDGQERNSTSITLGANVRKWLREKMLLMLPAVSMQSMQSALEITDALEDITYRPNELSFQAQVEYSAAHDYHVGTSVTLNNLSKSLLTLKVTSSEDAGKRIDAASSLVNVVSNVLEASVLSLSDDTGKPEETQRLVSSQLLSTIENVQSTLLLGKLSDEEPAVLTTPSLSIYINRMRVDSLEGKVINVKDSGSATFTLPSASSLNLSVEADETVDIRMVSFSLNPFVWYENYEINGAVAGLALTRDNGSAIPVNNLAEDIEIILTRSNVTEENQTVLQLGNSSTVMVNVTSSIASLVIQLDPDEDISLVLYLGYGYYPNESSYDSKAQLPNKQYTGDGRYTWVVSPEELIFGTGTFYLVVSPMQSANLSTNTNITVPVTTFTSHCVFWDEFHGNWSGNGCRVGPKTAPTKTQCLCNHLTFFGSSFFVMPNVIDVSKTAELFATFVDNPVVVTTVGCIFILYILAVIWARRKDIQDTAKVKITVLEDNDPFAEYRYLITVFTGHRRGAATTSKVTITLYCSEGESDPHHLTDPDGPIFERGGSDMFLLTTLFPLGEMQSIRLWHDNSGASPSWYVNRVIIHDMEVDQKWYFLCNSWLSIDVGDCVLDRVFPVATEAELKQFSNLFFMKTVRDFRDGHLWYSVLSRPPRSSFTRVQRVSCCFSLLLCVMLTSIMFWGVPKDPAEQKMDLGKIEFTWQEVMIGFESSLLMFPINLLIVQIFRNVRPQQIKAPKEKKQAKHGQVSPSLPPSPKSNHNHSLSPEAVIKDIKRIANSLSKTLKTPLSTFENDFGKITDINKLLALVEDIILQQNRAGQEFYNDKKKEDTLILTLGSMDLQGKFINAELQNLKRSDYNRYLYLQLQHIEKELELLGPDKFQRPQCYMQAVQQVQHMKDLLENQMLSSGSSFERFSPVPSLSGDSKKSLYARGLPWWFVFIGWFLVAATSGVAAFFTMLYGLHYGKDSSIKWLISMAISFFESLFITQPLKVLGFAAFFALVLKKAEQEDEEGTTIDGPLTGLGDSNAHLGVRRDSSSNIYQPPPPTDIERMKKNYIKEQKVFELIREILAYLGFLWMLLLVAYGQRDPNSYYLNRHIEDSFTNGFHSIHSYRDFFTWTNTTLISNLYGYYPGFITDGNSKLVGSARIRQVRVKKDSCQISEMFQSSIKDCRATYSFEDEEMESYGERWNTSAAVNSTDLSYIWQYQSQAKLRGHAIWGKLAMYRGGGYVADLGTDKQSSVRVLQYLFNTIWLDVYSRAIFVEFTVYNANVNLFCIVTLMLETNALGAFFTHVELQSVRLYPYTDGLHIFVVAAEVIYFLFIIYYMVLQGKLIKEQKWSYFHSKWNLLELAIILISWSALSVFIKRTLLGLRDIDYYQNHRDEFASFYETATADAVLGYLIAFLVLLATVKLWHLLRLNPKLNMITSTLRRAWGDISGFITVIVIMFLAYSVASNIMFGWKLHSYKTLFDAAETMVSLQLGIFNYEEVLDYNPVLGSFLIGSCIIFMTFVVLNLFISVILVAFSEEQKQYQPSEEEEIVDLMLMKLCSFFGAKCKKEESQAEVNITKAISPSN
ncbi:polycystin-1-like protein 2 [Latimeria chalumnae]|uniref:polycystin-1-like protein 2 n=1 Tax=Latimeria chalumnae TaxID=7897 RepID=UPI00313D345C